MTSLAQKYNKENPFLTELVANYGLNKEGSQKDTRHFSISLKGSDIEYAPGDALYICPENDPELVKQLLTLVKPCHGVEDEELRFAREVNITRASNKLYKLIESKLNQTIDANQLAERFNGYSIPATLKILKQEYPQLELTTDEIAENSSKLQARAYSIASSLSAHPELVELCIARVDEEINGQRVLGVCSNYISHRVPLNQRNLRIYVHVNEKFRLPEDHNTDIIMVGPGTGIAPFRSFIEERNSLRDQGKQVGRDWLFFGDQREACDFIYGEELNAYAEKYNLKITKAFSRDQAEKIYVQTRMKEMATELFQWLENGAYFYVCGDARRMAKDVDLTLQEIISSHGKDPVAYLQNLKDAKRYCRDVY